MSGTGLPTSLPKSSSIDGATDGTSKPFRSFYPVYILVDPPGFTDDWARVLEALYDLRASRLLPDDEKAELERVIVLVEQTVYPR